MVEEMQEYQQIWKNLWKEWYYTALYSWHYATCQETGDIKVLIEKQKIILGFIGPGLMA
jgi:hypothetical protein